MEKQKRYVLSYFVDERDGFVNHQTLFDSYDEAINFYFDYFKNAPDIKSVCLETLIIDYIDTSVLKD